MKTDPDRLSVFISSRMKGLQDLRAILRKELEKLEVDAFVYEVDQGAHPDDPEQVSLMQVEKHDLFVLVIGDSYGEITEKEYDKARELNKPCLVYERLGRPKTDKDLERFVEKLSGARKVPSRRMFQNAVDLAENVAKDVNAWLVREYRRLSAALQDTNRSSRRAAKLKESINRLSATTSQSLPNGNSGDLLAWQLQEWFEALEFPLELEPESKSGYYDLLIRVPARRKYSRVLVRAINGVIQGPDVENARVEARERSVDETWLVSLRRVSPAARVVANAHENVFVYTFDELIEEDFNFDRYFEWLAAQVEAIDLNELYVPLAVTVNEIDASGALHSQSTYENIADYVDLWLEDTDGEHLSLLGEFGTGKSWFALKYAHDIVGRYREAQERGLQRPRVPLVVRLREYARGFKNVESLLTDFVFREHEIKIPSFKVLEALNRMERLLFIFDGFDEMAARVDQQKMVDNFWSLAAVLGTGSKAILTCRTEYFRFAKQAREVLSGKLRGSSMQEVFEATRFQVATLEMFNEEQLRDVFARRGVDQALIEAVLSNQKLVDLGRRPVMIDLLIEAMPNLRSDTADLAQVYYQAVKLKMERDIKQDRTFTSMADKIFFMCEISWEMLSTHEMKILYKQIPDRIRSYFGSRVDTREEDHWRHDLLSQTMLVRDDDGFYRPAHRSLIEFFSAYKLAAEIGALKEEYVEAAREHVSVNRKREPLEQRWSDFFQGTTPQWQSLAPLSRFVMEPIEHLEQSWGRRLLDNTTRELIFLLCGTDALLEAVRILGSFDNQGGQIAARVLEVAAFASDLRGADISGSVLYGCQLIKCDLSNAHLSKSTWVSVSKWNGGKLEQVTLENASLEGAHFDGIQFIDISFRGANLSNSRFENNVQFNVNVIGGAWCTRDDEEILIAVLGDGRIVSIAPLSSNVQAVSSSFMGEQKRSAEKLGSWLLDLNGVHEFPELGQVLLTGCGWLRGDSGLDQDLSDGLRGEFSVKDYAGANVECLHIKIVRESTEEIIWETRICDAVEQGGHGRRFLNISRSGTRIAIVEAKTEKDLEQASILGLSNEDDIPLHNFSGYTLGWGPRILDRRGAAFSPSETLLAICERKNVVAFWRTETGEFICRVKFDVNAQGCVIDGAIGLPPELVASVEEDHDGWEFEASTNN